MDHAHQGKGAGRELIRTLASWLNQHDYRKMRLWVLEDNPSCRFYEKLGGARLSGAKTVELGGKTLTEVAYGWPDLSALL
jgi:GNAT superfamily N-acetyltransferase